jgi:hypothetical protein
MASSTGFKALVVMVLGRMNGIYITSMAFDTEAFQLGNGDLGL